ncbi:mucin-5AC isoform X3 [Cryptotermes secundus]|uniref:mucin-5AC isoform X3 n=1 Tax=Cryptotermes secundus TaxID=105785 RepID=UPI000CD7B524|nr:mucin-5AC isoform X3 [Cryptotermes secundus]
MVKTLRNLLGKTTHILARFLRSHFTFSLVRIWTYGHSLTSSQSMASSSSTVRQTVTTTVQQNPSLDNNLDALLEDLQTSVSRPPSSAAVNGITIPGSTQTYREVTTRTIQHDGAPGYQVQYLSAANPTTVVSERASSPGVELLQQQQQGGGSMTTYKTLSYKYNTSTNTTQPNGSSVSSSDPTSDARLQQNLNELDSLLVDLHQAQKAGFGTDQGGVVSTSVTSTQNIDQGLLEPVDHSTPTRQHAQQVTRVVQQRTYTDVGGTSPSPGRYQNEPPSSPRLQPKRSSSTQRELMYGTVDTQHRPARSPSPMRHPDPSPRVAHRSVVQKDTYYESKGSSTPKQERYRDKSPTNRRLQKELYYETSKSSTPIPPSPQHDRYRETSPPSQRRGTSPVRPLNQSPPDLYTGQPAGSSSRITTVRTYNYNNTGNSGPSPVPPVSHSTAPLPCPTPRYTDHSTQVVELTPSPSPVINYSPAPQTSSGTKVTTTVRTYTYEHPGQPGINHTYPPGTNQSYQTGTAPQYLPGTNQPHPPGTVQSYSENYSPTEHPSERTLTYQVSPREKEPLTEPPPTVITYKYSSHSSHSTSSKFPTQPEEQQPLLPRPFPTPSPTPAPNTNSQPPKRLDDLMASFSDTESTHHYPTEKHTHQSPPPYAEGINGVAVVTPTPNATAKTALSAAVTTSAAVKDRPKTKNITGPPVYYPPGVELFAKKEESLATQGKKESGRYEYEYGKDSKSKSSSSGGAAVVPVCLPLCCAMPCVIM